MLYASLKLIHLLSIVVWVGGMVFAHFFLRPATQALEPAVRVRLMHDVLERFFAAVLVAVVLMLASGVWMIGNFARQVVQSGGSFAMPLGWTVMATLGLVMVAIFGHIRFALYKRLQRAVAATDWPTGGKALIGIRTWVGINLALGVLTVAVALLMSSALFLALLPVLPAQAAPCRLSAMADTTASHAPACPGPQCEKNAVIHPHQETPCHFR